MLKGKRVVALFAMICIAMVFTACTDGNTPERQSPSTDNQTASSSTPTPSPSPEPTPEPEPEATGFRRGIWQDNVWTSEYLGINLVLDEGWIYATDEEIAGVLGVGLDFMAVQGVEIDIDILEAMGSMHDLMASNPETGANIQVVIERLVFPHNRMTVEQYMEAAAEGLQMVGMEVNFDFPGTTRIGNYDWHSYGSVMDMLGTEIFGRYFVNLQDGIARIIMFVYHEGSETVEDMLRMFN